MDLTFTEQETAFRDELRAWLADNHPGDSPPNEEDAYGWRRDFQRRLADGGWAAVHWPVEFGGRGASLTQSAIFFEELARARAPLPANVLGLLLAGPTIMIWGSDEQKERLLAPIVTAEEIWCQGFSEPEAGSDLAALKTRAIKDNGGWRITGQKVWTSGAQYSKWCMLVARTDTEAPKHKGLTYFLMDMEQEAVQVRPLRQITGEAEFNELFIEEARVPDENVLGGVGNGWKVALTTLMNERAGLAFFLQVRLRQVLDEVFVQAAQRGLLDDAVIADRLGELHLKTEVLRLTAYRGLTAVQRYGQPGPEGSLTKWMWSETNQQLTQLAADLIGPEALAAGGSWSYELMRARGNTIEGGTTEILKNIVAERVLGLPEGALDMDFDLSEEQKEIKQVAHALLTARSPFSKVRAAAEAGAYDPALWSELVELGWPGIAVGGEHGGQGLGTVELAVLLEELGYACAATPFFSTATAAAVIEATGSGEQRERWLPGLASGEATAGIGTRELAADAQDAAVVVLLDGEEVVLVDRRQADVEPFVSIDPTRRFATVAGEGEALGPGAADRVRAALAAEVVGVCQRALDMTIEYVKDRKQFGVPVGSFQAVSHRCAQMLLQTESGRSAAYFAAWAAEADPERLPEAAALAAAATADGGRDVTASAIQAHGGIGFTWEADVHWLYKRAQLDAALLGGSGRHRAALARIGAARGAGVAARAAS